MVQSTFAIRVRCRCAGRHYLVTDATGWHRSYGRGTDRRRGRRRNCRRHVGGRRRCHSSHIRRRGRGRLPSTRRVSAPGHDDHHHAHGHERTPHQPIVRPAIKSTTESQVPTPFPGGVTELFRDRPMPSRESVYGMVSLRQHCLDQVLGVAELLFGRLSFSAFRLPRSSRRQRSVCPIHAAADRAEGHFVVHGCVMRRPACPGHVSWRFRR